MAIIDNPLIVQVGGSTDVAYDDLQFPKVPKNSTSSGDVTITDYADFNQVLIKKPNTATATWVTLNKTTSTIPTIIEEFTQSMSTVTVRARFMTNGNLIISTTCSPAPAIAAGLTPPLTKIIAVKL